MIGGGAFLLLKAGCEGPETAKQAEIRLAGFPTILAVGRSGEPDESLQESRTAKKMQILVVVAQIPEDMANVPNFEFLLSGSQY
jgi:hypothetical protein